LLLNLATLPSRPRLVVEHKINVKKKEAFDFVLANTWNVQIFAV
jgi:hypothetical protein